MQESEDDMKMGTAIVFIWMSVSVAVIFGIWHTNNVNCLWAFVIPTILTWSISGSNNHSKGKKETED